MATMYPSKREEYVLLGEFALTSNTATTQTLSDSLDKYGSILITQFPITDGHSVVTSPSSALYILTPVSYFKSQTSGITAYFVSGTAGSTATTRITVCTYVSDTQIKFKQSGNYSRTYYVYGI